MSEPILKVKDLTYTYSGSHQALKGITLDVMPGCLLYTSDAADEL